MRLPIRVGVYDGHWHEYIYMRDRNAQNYSEQALLRIWAWGIGLHIILNRRRVGVAIILNHWPFSFFLLWAWWGIYTP